MAEEPDRPPRTRKPRQPRQVAGPTDIADPLLRQEAKRAFVWLGMAALLGLAVVLAQPLLVIFGGMVFGAMIDGGARLLGRVLHIKRGWRVAIVLLAAAAFLAWVAMFAGSQIAQQAAELPSTINTQSLRVLAWLKGHGFSVDTANVQGIVEKVMGGVAEVTRAVGGLIGALTTLFLIVVLGIYFAAEPRLYQRGLAWMLPADKRHYFEGTANLMGKSLRRLLAGRLLAFLPNIGAPISGALMVLVGFSGGTDMGLYCIFVYVLIHTIDGNIIVPLVAKKTVDLAPALVLGAQLIMGALFGILGLALADPMVAMIKVWLEREAARHEPTGAH